MELNLIIENIEEELAKLKNIALNKVADELVEDIINVSNDNRNIFVYGAGRSGFIGKAFVMRLVQAGVGAFFISEPSMRPMHKGDLLIVISGTGKTPSVLNIIETSKKNLADIILLTSNLEAESELIDKIIKIEGKSKTENTDETLPLGSFFEINSFIFLECIVGKMFQGDFKENFKDISDRYKEGKIPVI